jgi:hypothetical protein
VGEWINRFNRPHPKSLFHVKGPDGACLRTEFKPETTIETTPEQDAQHTEPETTTESTSDMLEWSALETTPEVRKPSRKAPPAGSIEALIGALVDARLEGFEPSSAVDEATVRRIVLECATTTTVEIKRLDNTTAKIEGAHYLMPRLLRLLGAGINVYLWGPAGSGKTTAALVAAKALREGATGEIDTLDPSTPKSAVLGYRTPTGEPVPTAFTRCYGDGSVYIADECDNAPAHVQTLFNSALANGHAPTAWGLIPRHEHFGFVGTGNTPGRPTPQFPDRRPMSAAFADRLYFMHWPLDTNIERRACGRALVAAPKRVEASCTPSEWGKWVEDVREWAAKNAPTLMVTPRAAITGRDALALGETPEEVAHGLVFRGADPTLVGKALTAVPLP